MSSQAGVRGYLLRARLRNILKEAQDSNLDIHIDEEDQDREVTELLSSVIDEVSVGSTL